MADGRDMGTVIFPDATLKVFLTASVEARAERRYKQLIDKGFSANMDDLLRDLRERDARDANRAVAPLKPAEDAKLLDTSDMTADQAVEQVLDWYASGPGCRPQAVSNSSQSTSSKTTSSKAGAAARLTFWSGMLHNLNPLLPASRRQTG